MSEEVEPMEEEQNEEMDHDDLDSSSDESDSMEEAENEDDANEETNKESKNEVYLPGTKIEEGEELVMDETAYRIFHQASTGAPCLSFDIIKDRFGSSKETYPFSMHIVAGTQAARAHVNNLLVMKMYNIYGSDAKEDSDEESDESEDDEDKDKKTPKMRVASIKHQGCVNRVRCTEIDGFPFAATWSELGRVSLWNLSEQLKAVEDDDALTLYNKKCEKQDSSVKPIFTFKGHLSEGYGIDWCPTELGTLATGDCKGNIHVWRCTDNEGVRSWHVDQRPYNSHASHSVEDLQWKPDEKYVLASCSVDKSIKIWDTRANPQSACMLTAADAHSSDVNVISWNKKETQYLVSGGDDGVLRVWDLRQFNSKGASPVATFKQHTAPVTTVEWHPEETTVFASGGADDVISQWDLSVETDEAEELDEKIKKLPPQLLFIHQGQTDVKELHWHPQYPGVVISTAHSGFNIFRTISV